MEDATPESGYQKFKKSKAALPVGMVLGILVGAVLFYIGLYSALCGLGLVLIAAVLFIIAKWFGGKSSFKKMAVFGVVCFLGIVLIGAFAVSMPVIENNNDVSHYDSEGFSDLTITYSGADTITSISVKYNGTVEAGQKVVFHMGKLNYICYNGYGVYTMNDTDGNNGRDVELTLSGGVYTSGTISMKMDSASVYGYYFKIVDGDNNVKTSSAPTFHKVNFSSSDEAMFVLMWNGYYAVIILVLFLIISFFSVRANKKLESVRAQMEADGRLYPKGYGRCKQCGTVVLPGETNCRKCGAFIEVPEEYLKKQAEYFECSECGAHIPADSVFCPKCGAKFDEEDETVVVPDEKTIDVPAEITEEKSEETSEEKPTEEEKKE